MYDRGVLESQRHILIRTALSQSRYLSVRDAMVMLGVSAATVRRDFRKLVLQGHAYRLHGGIERCESRGVASDGRAGPDPRNCPGSPDEAQASDLPLRSLPLDARTAVRAEAKRRIAARAALLVADGQTVFLDGGSTTLELARLLRERDVRVITNSFTAAETLVSGRAVVVLTGGTVDPTSRVIVGLLGDEVIKHYTAHLFFMGAVGIDKLGVTNSDDRLVRSERAMMEHSDRTVVLADSSKFEARGDARVCGLAEVSCIITDASLPSTSRTLVDGLATELIVV